MILPSPMHFALWGSALYRELATGLWQALAAPWLEPGCWPGPTHAADRHRPPHTRTAAAGAATREERSAAFDRVEQAHPRTEAPEQRVIEVPRARWRERRAADGASSSRR
jgi:hypothetical protein